MKKNSSRILILTALAIAFLSMLSSLLVNLLTNDNDFKLWLEAQISTLGLVSGVLLTLIALLVFTYFQVRHAQRDEADGNEIVAENIEPDIKKLFDSLKDRYQKRYQSKLDGRFEITLEVSDDFDSKPRSYSEQFGENTPKSVAIERIREVFESKGRLLIVGNPGIGKTALLLKFAIDALDKIEDLEHEPFPVILNLASWSDQYENFGNWLSAMLVSGYGFSKAFAETFLQKERIIFLLDGLDELARGKTKEIASEKRARCLASLNEYLSGERKAVICSRIEEFLLIKRHQKQDAPVSAKVLVRNLTKKQVLGALRDAENDRKIKHRTAANNLLKIIKEKENDKLLEVLSTPFYFTTAMEVFDRQIPNEKDLPKSAEEIKLYLMRKFVEIKLSRENNSEYENERTKKWLKRLACLMERKQLITFELADLEPTDLDKKWKLGLIIGLIYGLFSGVTFGLISGLVGGLAVGLISGLISGLVFGVIFGLLFGLVFGLSLGWREFENVESITYLQSPYQRLFRGFFVDLFLAGVILLAVIIFILSIIYVAGFILFLVDILLFRVEIESNDLKYLLNSLWSLAVFFPLYWIINTELFKHLILRLCLYLENKMPLKYATFLDYAASLRILEKDSGQWRFRHQNLQEYFAKLDD